jgi:hypothetical protein
MNGSVFQQMQQDKLTMRVAGGGHGAQGDANAAAWALYNQLAAPSGLGKWLSRARRLKVLAHLPATEMIDLGAQPVPIERIIGTESRQADFDALFRPLRKTEPLRWVNIAVAWLTDVSLPPVALLKVGEDYYVRDGHHRISVARALGQHYIDAVVVGTPAAA